MAVRRTLTRVLVRYLKQKGCVEHEKQQINDGEKMNEYNEMNRVTLGHKIKLVILQIPKRLSLIGSLMMFRDYLSIIVVRDGMRARSTIMGNKPLVPLYMIKQLGLLQADLKKYYKTSIPKSHMYEFLEDVPDDKTRKELRKLLDKVYK